MRVFFNMLAYGDLPTTREMPQSYLEMFQAASVAYFAGEFEREYKKILAKP